jgi:phytanoyl-CoA hydroxylase
MALTQTQVDQFHEDGYLQVDGMLRHEDLNPVIWEFEGIIDRRAREMYDEGFITQLHEREPFDRRIGLLAQQAHAIAHNLGANRVLGCAMFNLMRKPRLLDALESLIGSEILCHPTQVVRPRMRDRDTSGDRWRTTDIAPWHQDAGVLRPEADDTLLITAWIPLTRADEENGCLCVIPGSHKHGVRHHEIHFIPEDQLPPGEPRSLPIDPGGVIFFSNLVCHSGLPHQSDRVRWSVDLRYQDAAQPTGHPFFSGFMARSRKNPESELNYAQWVGMWKRQFVHSEPWPPVARWPGAK